MARQSTSPVQFNRSTRIDEGVLMSSGRAGVVVPALVIPFLKGDSGAGAVSIDVNLAEMPKPLLNATFLNAQCWFVPKSAFPQFSGTDEFLNSYTKTTIRALGQADRTPPPYFVGSAIPALSASPYLTTLGVHVPGTSPVNVDYIDAFTLVYNFRLAAHSSKLPLKKYFQEDANVVAELPPAFWPSGRWQAVVPDYEKALLVGQLDLDITAGNVPVRGLYMNSSPAAPGTGYVQTNTSGSYGATPETPNHVFLDRATTGDTTPWRVFADLANETIGTSLADIDKARTAQAMGKIRASMAGNDSTGFMSDDMILAYLMQGISVPPEYFRRPWLVGQQRVAFGFAERHATDGASLDQSITEGRTSVRLPLNVPQNDAGGYLVVILEVLPERLDERQTDEAMLILDPDLLPNALRDVQRTEPVDLVTNRRLDAAHTTPDGLYGYEPMNNVWNRSFTRLGGIFYQPDPTAPVTESRAGIWQAGIIDPSFNEDHFLAPVPFPYDVFSDTLAPAFEFVVRHSCQIVGNTQIGDALVENNDDYEAVIDGGLIQP